LNYALVSFMEGIDMKIRVFGLIIVTIMLLAILPALSTAAPQVFIETDRDSYKAGDTIEVSLAGDNQGEGMSVDVYIGLLTPNGSLWTCGWYWSEAINPWIEGIYVPAGFTMNQKRFFSFDLPSGMPPIADPGEYSFAAVLTEPGTFNWVCEASFGTFTVFSVTGVDYYVDAALGEDYEWYDGSEDLPWKTITHALNSVVASPAAPATIHVAAGVYSTSTNGETFPLNMKSWVSLVGDGADVTVLDAESAANVIWGYYVDDWTIEGFMITGGKSKDGGGIYCETQNRWCPASCTVANNTITGNSAQNGGGIFCGGGWPMVRDNVISGNHATNSGGGIYSECPLTIQNNAIEGNSCDGRGGAVCCSYSSWVGVLCNTIRGNSADEGGGIYNYRHTILVFGNLIADNSAGSHGGGVFCWCSYASVQSNTIEHNSADLSGGGLYTAATSIIIFSNYVIENSSQHNGGGILSEYAEIISNNLIALNSAGLDGGGVVCDYPPTEFQNNTIADNVAGGLGGGVWSYGPSEITDSIIWNNGDDLYNCTARYCCVQDPDEGEGNIHADPLFVDGPYGHYYLDPNSPCVDAGSCSPDDAGLLYMTTQARSTPDFWTVDLGYHYPIPFESWTKANQLP